MPNYTLKINAGEGLGFDQEGRLTVRYTGNHITTITEGIAGQLGLYVDPLTGSTGSVADGWTTMTARGKAIPGSSVSPASIDNFIDVNREVVNQIYTYGVYHVAIRNNSTIAYDTTQVRSLQELCYEMNFPVLTWGGNKPFFKPRAGELIQLVNSPSFVSVRDSSTSTTLYAAESGRREGDNIQQTMVLFMINEILYASDIDPSQSDYLVSRIKMTCLYSSVASYVVGTEYQYGY